MSEDLSSVCLMDMCDACLKTRTFTANAWLINFFATQPLGVFLKANIFSKSERKKLKFF